ncbi:UTRA domain-containing protein [Phyllobacterium sp. SB3]|uniref:UTRA domain-containing protein n=1 Tax=Phyllobacterium sp. SB3 TaxID=3156073 RepID=UPI0032AEBC0F
MRSDIERRILSGEWAPGYRIPIERELMETYGCARMTVNKALVALVASGLIERRRRAGSFVSQPLVQSAVIEISDVRAEVEAVGQVYSIEILSRRQRTSTVADMKRLDIQTPRPVLAVLCRHLAGKRVHAFEDRLIDLVSVPDAAGLTFEKDPPGTWLREHVPWSEAENRISALNADSALSAHLGVKEGAACLQVERSTWRGTKPITAVRMYYPGDTYRLIAHFSPKGS